MKPKTNFQRMVVALSKKLKPISQKQTNWAVKNLSKKYAIVSRNRTFCLECGHKWNENIRMVELTEKCVCPSCKAKLKYNSDRNIRYEDSYFAIVTTQGGMQVVRMFLFHQNFKKKQKSTYWISEVMQHWIDEDGEYETLSQPVNTMSNIYDAWSYGPLEVRTHTYNHHLRFTINPYKVYPIKCVLPIIKRNGFNGSFGNYSPQQLFCLLLKDNRVETLYKSGQISVLNCYNNRDGLVSGYWKSINICTRHSYIIPDAITWFDYMDLLRYFRKDTSNPKFICPENLKAAHDTLLKKKRKIEAEERRIRKEEARIRAELADKKNQKKYSKQKGMFFGLKFKAGDIIIQPITTIAGFKEEADNLNHCVYSNKYFNKEDSLIMSARINGKPIETIELSLTDYKIIQSRGKCNQASEYHDKIIETVRKNISKIAEIKEVQNLQKTA
ncbi:PcfJ domain-containing protein [Marinifilum flexuosum]|uniref:PcfJ-like protein n=1 Tax=Marinifilum flexuosum TaxID=1117708 RepID=A0A419WMR2_9BACT|nr:PcfJ domain-containing protein [Marinifilum flexuosum]RKD96770.1 PcfJ-like protein [Marinifilum flexuosum]